ncbi:MAG: O-antigen polysaccharide polymerase Wzy [Flavobacterium sp.]|nr:O-antigen polysaccharide polymerase Wzy [Flavobacterium sp.]HRB72363.1 O-antigen polysaccharide polymerase Wzy [Flavobacterium sp.]
MTAKSSFLFFFTLIFAGLFVFFNSPVFVKLSFLANFIVLWLITYYNIFLEKRFSPFLSVYLVFNLLFFIVAPMVQIDSIVSTYTSGGHFIQKFPFREDMCIRANIYLVLFHIIFFLSYLKFNSKTDRIPDNHFSSSYKNTPFILTALLVLTLLIVLVNLDTIIFQYQNEFYKEVDATSTSQYLIVQKFLFFIPMFGVILAHSYLKNNPRKTVNFYYVAFYLLFFLGILLMLKNPLTEKRNALGPIYITLIFIFFRKYIDTNFKTVRFMFLSMILLFPLLTIITHSRYSLSQMITKPHTIIKNIEYLHVTDAFNSLHYDAYPNFLATIDYHDKKEVVAGEQLLGSVFFFVPRSIWHDKPETTGFKIGNYLIAKYKFNFNNLSNPYISEGYLNFGLLGILIFPIVLAYFFSMMTLWIRSNDYLKVIFAFYTAIYLMYFLRGDLTNGIAYLVAFWLAILFVPKFMFALLKYYERKN